MLTFAKNAHYYGLPILRPAAINGSIQASSSTTATTAEDHEKEQIQPREDYWNPPPGMPSKLPYYHRNYQKKPHSDSDCKYKWLKEEAASEEAVRVGARLMDYYKMQQIVNWLPTIKEKIDFVNPYERDWEQSEKRWHRAWLQPLVRPRRAWAVPPLPAYFDTLDFYKHITKCRLITGKEAADELNKNYFQSLTLPTTKFEERVSDSLSVLLAQMEQAQVEEHSDEAINTNRAKFMRSLIEDAHLVLANGNPKLLEHRISYTPRCESFWIRGGFLSLYEHLPPWETEAKAWEPPYWKRKMRFTGDDRRRLGELAFTMRDQHILQVRSKKPMKNLFPMTDTDRLHTQHFPADFNVDAEVIFSPKMFNLFPDGAPLWQCPGYEYDSGETHQFGRLAVKDVKLLSDKISKDWRCASAEEKHETMEQCVQATAIVSLFSWLIAQAHCLGHTQYTEIQEPLTSQMVLTDGQQFWFAVGQLNTIAINVEADEFPNRRTNCCYVDGPYNLYDIYERTAENTFKFSWIEKRSGGIEKERIIITKKKGKHMGLNQTVLERLLQMCVV